MKQNYRNTLRFTGFIYEVETKRWTTLAIINCYLMIYYLYTSCSSVFRRHSEGQRLWQTFLRRSPPPRNLLSPICFISWRSLCVWGARWSSGQCARRAIAEAKHRSQWPVLGWVTKIYYLELLRASEGTLSRWSRLHLQSVAPNPVSRSS
jgi:hypothetical protein